GADRRVAGPPVQVPDDRRHSEPPRDPRPRRLAPSYAVLCAMQAATIMLPRPSLRRGRIGWLGLLAPAGVFGSGILLLRLLAGGPHALALVGAVATPVLAAARRGRAPFALALWPVAWLCPRVVP